ncbi:FecR family protein [Puia dinghuensis]|uniref:FecR family protein n=1 Tax=Puia dinghuensis TaxID=1792502 RepID=A0A8J2XWG2_9BACT|nr:FecR family protein [Puia dinghuensis]GGB26292.1 hypothetical protein GCM10011511_57800 [Puia dinghuensis]
MQPEYSPLSRLIVGRLFGTETKTQKAKLDAWINASEANRRKMEQFNSVRWFARVWQKHRSIDPRTTWELIRARTANQPGVPPLPDLYLPEESSKVEVHRIGKWVVALILVLGVAFGILWLGTKTAAPLEEDTYSLHASATIANNADFHATLGKEPVGWLFGDEQLDFYKPIDGVLLCSYHPSQAYPELGDERQYKIVTPANGTYTIVLPDESTIDMGPASTLHFTTSYGRYARELKLAGDGFFEVKPVNWLFSADEKPFIVHIDSVTITAFGTRFQVEADDRDSGEVRATLLSGTIEVQRGANTPRWLRRPGQAYLLNKDGKDTVLSLIESSRAVEMAGPVFFYRDEPMNHILQDLSHYYHIRFVSHDAMTESFTFQASKTISLDSLLRNIEKTGRIHFSIGKDSIIVSR